MINWYLIILEVKKFEKRKKVNCNLLLITYKLQQNKYHILVLDKYIVRRLYDERYDNVQFLVFYASGLLYLRNIEQKNKKDSMVCV